MKTPYNEIIDHTRENLDQTVENDINAQTFMDSFTIWLLGLSVGSIALLIGNIENVAKYYPYWILKTVFALLFLSILTGILQRLILFNLRIKYNQAMFYVRGAFSGKNTMQVEIYDISEITDFEELVNLLKFDFDLDYSKSIETYQKADDVGKAHLFNILSDAYKKNNLWAKQSFEDGVAYVTKIFRDVHLYNGKDINPLVPTKNTNLKKLDGIQTLCLYFSCLCFVLSILIMMIWY